LHLKHHNKTPQLKMPKTKTKPTLSEVKSLSDLEQKAQKESRFKDLAHAAVQNLGCEHLCYGTDPFDRNMAALRAYWGCLCSEYGLDESEAEEQLIDEINFVRDCV
jgi:hypothetical protein